MDAAGRAPSKFRTDVGTGTGYKKLSRFELESDLFTFG